MGDDIIGPSVEDTKFGSDMSARISDLASDWALLNTPALRGFHMTWHEWKFALDEIRHSIDPADHQLTIIVTLRADRQIGRQKESTSFSARFVANPVAAMDIKNCISSNVMRSFEHCKIHMIKNYLPACCVHHRIQGYDNLPCAGVVAR